MRTFSFFIALCFALPLSHCAAYKKQPRASFTNSIGLEMKWIPAGKWNDSGVDAFYIGATEITNSQYEMFKAHHREERNPNSPGDQVPVTSVSWDEAQLFVEWLSKRENLPYRLPNEEEWEWAARGGNAGFKYATADGTIQQELVNIAGTKGRDQFSHAAPVATFPPNPFGLYDMSGNVWEWCDGWYYKEKTLQRVWLKLAILGDVEIPFFWYGLRKKWRVARGGSYVHEYPLHGVYVRNAFDHALASHSFGFRVALSAEN